MSSDATAADVFEVVGRVDRAATEVVGHWLADVEGFGDGEPQTLADMGALAGRLAPSVLVNAHLMWRGTAIEVLENSDVEPALIEQVRIVLADRCDAGLLAVSRQFDEPRDRLTGLANRPMLLERVGHALQAAGRYGDSVGLIFVEPNLDQDAPHELLLEIADRLRRVARASDTVARVGGNAFVICAERLRSDLEAVAIADRALLALHQPYAIDGEELHVTANAGIAVSSGGDGPETLLANASTARRAALGH
jgi:diguanylate cyclase (GGDEF)-like protein